MFTDAIEFVVLLFGDIFDALFSFTITSGLSIGSIYAMIYLLAILWIILLTLLGINKVRGNL